MTPSQNAELVPPDSVFRWVSDQSRVGTLHGYRLVISSANGWHFAVINSKGYTQVCPRVASFAEAARRAREWVERNGPRS